jgi:Calcineurin-like phosphoesterase
MSRRRRRARIAIAALGLLTAIVALVDPSVRGAAREATQNRSPRIVAIGDVHGAFEPFVEILQTAGLIDANQKWIGGSAVLVQTGDVFDRGARVRDVLDLLMRLEGEADRAGGRVEALLGNHEVMNVLSDLRDVLPAAYAAFADKRSEDRRKRAYDDYLEAAKRRSGRGDPVASRDEWMNAHPPGFVEYVEAMGPRGRYGRWLRGHKVVTAVNGIGFMHAGIRPDRAGTLDDVNRTAAKEIASWDDIRNTMVNAKLVPPFCTLKEAVSAAAAEIERIAAALKAQTPLEEHITREYVDRLQLLMQVDKMSLFEGEGPLWFRGYAQWPETAENAAQLAALFTRLGVSRFVTGHTPMLPDGRILSRFDQRVFLIDTGMLSAYFKGRASALELQDGRVTAIYTDRKDPLVPVKSAHFVRVPFRDAFGGAAASAVLKY